MDSVSQVLYNLLDRGLVPDFIIRPAVRYLCRVRLREINRGTFEQNHAAKMEWIQGVRERTEIADAVDKANEQHYEVPTNFILSCLGPNAKYSCCLYPSGKETLEQAETLMLESYCEKAQLKDGQDILDLGCGWGSLSLFLAKKYRKSKIIGLSNSHTQKLFIDSTAKSRGLTNLEIITGDVNVFDFAGSKYFDRILSIEMFEHMKNYQLLLSKISTWLRDDDALLFIHIFCHKTTPYHFEEGDGWMAKTFFTGGTMPSHDLFLYFQSHVTLLSSWYIPGTHYARTSEDWLALQDANRRAGLTELEKDASAKGVDINEAKTAFYRFRVFYIAVAEFFGLDKGEEWGVGHYLFKRK